MIEQIEVIEIFSLPRIQIKILTLRSAVEINSINAGKQYTIEEIELGVAPNRKPIKYENGFLKPGTECKAQIKQNGNLIIISMKATSTELDLLNRLQGCSCLPGSFDKKFPKSIDPLNLSPLQQWWIYKLGYKYRKQIGNDVLTLICKTFLDSHEKPLSKREADKLLRKTASSPC